MKVHVGMRGERSTSISAAKSNIRGGYTYNTSLNTFWSLNNRAQDGTRGAGTREAMAVTRIVDDN